MVLDTTLNRSTPPLAGAQSIRTAKGFGEWSRNWDLIDVWRMQHGNDRDYLCFSSLYSLQVRLDNISVLEL